MRLVNEGKPHLPFSEDKDSEKFNNPYIQSRIIADPMLFL